MRNKQPVKIRNLNLGSLSLSRTFDASSYPSKDVEAMKKRFNFVEAPAKIEYFTKYKNKADMKKNMQYQKSQKIKALTSVESDTSLRPVFWFKQLMLNTEMVKEIKRINNTTVQGSTVKDNLFLELEKFGDKGSKPPGIRKSIRLKNSSTLKPSLKQGGSHDENRFSRTGSYNVSDQDQPGKLSRKGSNLLAAENSDPRSLKKSKSSAFHGTRDYAKANDVVNSDDAYKSFAHAFKKQQEENYEESTVKTEPTENENYLKSPTMNRGGAMTTKHKNST